MTPIQLAMTRIINLIRALEPTNDPAVRFTCQMDFNTGRVPELEDMAVGKHRQFEVRLASWGERQYPFPWCRVTYKLNVRVLYRMDRNHLHLAHQIDQDQLAIQGELMKPGGWDSATTFIQALYLDGDIGKIKRPDDDNPTGLILVMPYTLIIKQGV